MPGSEKVPEWVADLDPEECERILAPLKREADRFLQRLEEGGAVRTGRERKLIAWIILVLSDQKDHPR